MYPAALTVKSTDVLDSAKSIIVKSLFEDNQINEIVYWWYMQMSPKRLRILKF